jgi:hypothetical protein
MKTPAAAILFSLACLFAGFDRPCAIAAPPSPRTQGGPDYAAVCSTADILTMLAKGGLLQKAPHEAALLILARIGACRRIISQYVAGLPTPGPAIARNPPGLPPLPPPAARLRRGRAQSKANDPRRPPSVLGARVLR